MLFIAALLTASATDLQPIGEMRVFDPRSDQPSTCPAISQYETSRKGRVPEVRKLNQLPSADAYRAVYRHIGQCEVPIIVRYGVGR